MITRSRALVFLMVAVLGLTGTLHAQGGASGTLLGTVTDNSGAVVANARVDVTNVGTSVTTSTQTTSSGDFTVPFLSPGTYQVAVQAAGFQKSVTESINLVVGQEQRVNVTLKVGAITETVQISASAVTLDTDSSAVSHTVTQSQVENLPLNGRNFIQLLFLDAGAVQTGGEQASFRQGQGAAISVNGSRPESNNYLLDGMLNTDQAVNTPAVVLSVDAIQEFKVLSETYSAQYGFAANQISIVSKSGTNTLHGTGFYFGRNDALDAKNFFDPVGSKKNPLRQNQFGFVVNGPVVIPKLYNGKNKTFFLANYEGWRIHSGNTAFVITPTANQILGEFTHSVIDPVTHNPFPGCTAGGVAYTSCIPANRFSRVANVAIQDKFFPTPNCTACGPGGNNNVTFSNINSQTTNQQTYRLDQDLGKFGKVFGRGTYSPLKSTTPGTASGQMGDLFFSQAATNWAVAHTMSFGPNKVNQFSFGRLNAVSNTDGFQAPANVIQRLNFTGTFQNLANGGRVYPLIRWGNADIVLPSNQRIIQTTYPNFGGAVNAYGISENPMWQFVDSFTLIHGPHTFTFGGDFKTWRLHRNVANNFLGNLQFTGIATTDQFADFLLGTYAAAGTNIPAPLTPKNTTGNPYEYNFRYFASYFQDDWKVNQRLTLNLGLRWDIRSVPYETNNHFGWIDVTNPKGGVCIADPTVFSQGFADSTGYYRNCGTRSPASAEKKNFAPRFGFAWRPFGEKTVVRGGYGIFWDGIEGREMDGSADFYPYNGALALPQTAGQASYATTDQLFPSFAGGPVVPGPTGPNSFTVVTLSAPPYLKNPYVQQYTLSVQRQLTKNTVLDASYVGNKGTHLLVRNQINQALAFPNAAAAAACIPPPPPATLPANCTLSARRPFPNFGTYIDDRFIGYSNYNALNVKVEHRTSSMAVTAAYAWSKSLDDKSAAAGIGASQFNGWQGFLDNHNPRRDYGRSDIDTGHRFVASMIYNLPVGKGKRVLGSANSVEDAVLGGWQLTTIYTAQLGFPMSILAGDPTNLLDSVGQNRADLIGNPNGPKTINQWFNTSAFTRPAANLFGNSGRNIIRMPGMNNWDLGLMKNFRFRERAGLQIRIETFNSFNHPQFNPDPSVPAFSGGASTVGNNINNQATFGRITGAAPGRIVQLGAKLSF